MYKRKVESEIFYDRRQSTGSYTSTAVFGNELSSFSCNRRKSSTSSKDHYNPSLRLLQIPRSSNGSLGFHLTRSKWDPYPWVSAVDLNTPAKYSGLQAGDCVLEVNGEDILGLRIADIAKLVKNENIDSVTLLLWSAGSHTNCNPESLCCGPMPLNLERLSACMQTILSIIECPVCLNTIAPPILQCQNGHILCVKCRILSHTCPVCRQRFYPGRSLIAEQIYNSITDTFNLRNEDKLREKLFGSKYKTPAMYDQRREKQQQLQQQKQPQQLQNGKSLKQAHEVNKLGVRHHPPLPSNKFLARLLGLAYSMDNLNTSSSQPPSTASLFSKGIVDLPAEIVREATNDKDNDGDGNDEAAEGEGKNVIDSFDEQSELGNLPISKYSTRSVTISKQLSLSAHDLSKKDNDGLMAIERCPSQNRLHQLRFKRNSLQPPVCIPLLPITPPPSPLMDLGRRRICASLSPSIECVATVIHRDGMHPSPVIPQTVPNIQLSCCMNETRENIFYLCPCSCGNKYSGSKLQQHVKVDHRAPILCYGGSSAELSLPLKAPLNETFVLLVCDGRNFWIKLRTHGEGNITASALLQGPEDESSDFMMETRLRNRLGKDQEEGDNDYSIVVVENDNDDDAVLERELITRSIVRSMTVTTWEDTTYSSSSTGEKSIANGDSSFSQENIRTNFGEAIDYRNLLLNLIIKRRFQNQIATAISTASKNGQWLTVPY